LRFGRGYEISRSAYVVGRTAPQKAVCLDECYVDVDAEISPQVIPSPICGRWLGLEARRGWSTANRQNYGARDRMHKISGTVGFIAADFSMTQMAFLLSFDGAYRILAASHKVARNLAMP